MAPSSYMESIKSPKAEILIGSDSKTMNSHTTIDVVIILVIFLALIISFSVLAWKQPTSLGSPRAFPTHGTALPASNIAAPIATHGRGFTYLMHLRGALFVIYHWWTRASHNGIDGIPSITISHHEHTVARAPSVRALPVCSTRLSTRTPTSTIAFISSSGASTIISEAMELGELDKGLSTSSVPEGDEADITCIPHVVTAEEPIVRVGPVSEAHEPPLSTATSRVPACISATK